MTPNKEMGVTNKEMGVSNCHSTKPYCPTTHNWRGMYSVEVFDQHLKPMQEPSKALQTMFLVPKPLTVPSTRWTDTFQPILRIQRVDIYNETKDGLSIIALVSDDFQQAMVETTVAMGNNQPIKQMLQPGELIQLTKFQAITQCIIGCDSFSESSKGAHHCKCHKHLLIHSDAFEWVPDFAKTQTAISTSTTESYFVRRDCGSKI
jgi:hypothetical protein